MFGYVRPALNHLSDEDRAQYKRAYCGLCHDLGRRYGWLARLTLNYDFALLALLQYSVADCRTTQCSRCPIHPFKGKQVCVCGVQLDDAADKSVILTWYKLSDDVKDHGFWTGIPFRIFCSLFRKNYCKAAAFQPEFDRAVCSNLEKLSRLEREGSPRLDRVADTFAAILASAADKSLGEPLCRVMEQLLYHLGRWIYLLDAWDDLARDIKYNRYNPLDARFSGNALSEKDYIETTLTHSVHLVQSAANLLYFGQWNAIVENILYTGLPAVQAAVLDGKWEEMKKQGRRLNERSV